MSGEPLKVPVTTAQQEGSPVVPSPSTPAGGERRFVLDEVIATNQATGTYTDVLAKVRMSLPSGRLHAKLTFGFKPYSGEWLDLPTSGLGAWKVDIREFARTDKGQYIGGGLVVQGLVLPSSWEAITMSREWRATVTIPTQHDTSEGPADGTGLSAAGELHAVAEWEPAAGESPISNEELQKLFGACHLFVENAPLVYSNPGGG